MAPNQIAVTAVHPTDTRRVRFAWIVILCIAAVGTYYDGITAKYFGDDFQFVFESPSSGIFYYFTHNNPFNNFYRPLQTSFLALTQTVFGMSTAPIHVTQLLLHILLSWTVYTFMVHAGFPRLAAYFASLFMIISQANVHAVVSNDTFSQVCGTLFGCISLWLFYRGESDVSGSRNGGRHRRDRILGTGSFLLSLLSKESSASFLVALFIIAILLYRKMSGRLEVARRVIVGLAPYVIVFILYFAIRLAVVEEQPTMGEARYQFHIGANIIKNAVMFFFAASVPASSVSAYLASQSNLGLFSIFLFATVVSLTFILYGVWKSRHRRRLLLMGVLAIVSLVPMVALNHVSELYVYNAMPFVAVVIGVGLGRLVELGRMNNVRQAVTVVAIGLFFMSHVHATKSKTSLMRQNGNAAHRILAQIIPHAREMPAGGELVLVNPPGGGIEYSVFLIEGFNVLRHSLHVIPRRSGRADVTIKISEHGEVDDAARPGRKLLAITDDEVTTYRND